MSTLTWGNKHRFVMKETGLRTLAALMLEKQNGKQRVPVSLPPDVRIDTIERAWAEQGRNWIELVLGEGSPYLAVRAIWLPQGSILWYVFHLGEAPFDGCSYTNLTRERWESTRHGTLALSR